MNDMGIALELLGVGIVTVLLILSLVVLLGNLIIRFVNRFFPEDQNVSSQIADSVKTKIHPHKMAAIVSAVKIVTKGSGRVTRIQKM